MQTKRHNLNTTVFLRFASYNQVKIRSTCITMDGTHKTTHNIKFLYRTRYVSTYTMGTAEVRHQCCRVGCIQQYNDSPWCFYCFIFSHNRIIISTEISYLIQMCARLLYQESCCIDFDRHTQQLCSCYSIPLHICLQDLYFMRNTLSVAIFFA